MLLYAISHPISEKYFLAEDIHYYRKLQLVGIQMISGYFLSYKPERYVLMCPQKAEGKQ